MDGPFLVNSGHSLCRFRAWLQLLLHSRLASGKIRTGACGLLAYQRHGQAGNERSLRLHHAIHCPVSMPNLRICLIYLFTDLLVYFFHFFHCELEATLAQRDCRCWTRGFRHGTMGASGMMSSQWRAESIRYWPWPRTRELWKHPFIESICCGLKITALLRSLLLGFPACTQTRENARTRTSCVYHPLPFRSDVPILWGECRNQRGVGDALSKICISGSASQVFSHLIYWWVSLGAGKRVCKTTAEHISWLKVTRADWSLGSEMQMLKIQNFPDFEQEQFLTVSDDFPWQFLTVSTFSEEQLFDFTVPERKDATPLAFDIKATDTFDARTWRREWEECSVSQVVVNKKSQAVFVTSCFQ